MGRRRGLSALVATILLLVLTPESPAATPTPLEAKPQPLTRSDTSLPESCHALFEDRTALLRAAATLKPFTRGAAGQLLESVAHSVSSKTRRTILGMAGRLSGSVCEQAHAIAKQHSRVDERLGAQTLVAVQGNDGAAQAETDVFVAVIYAMFVMSIIHGMYAKMWCDNYFQKTREEWVTELGEIKADPDREVEESKHRMVDANYLKHDWEEHVLEEIAEKLIKADAEKNNGMDKKKRDKEDGPDNGGHQGQMPQEENAGGLKNVGKNLIRLHHEGSWPKEDGDSWLAPIDPFDTIYEHHMPAAHYLRVYCQEWHYSLGWRLMGFVHAMFKSGFSKIKQAHEDAKKAAPGSEGK